MLGEGCASDVFVCLQGQRGGQGRMASEVSNNQLLGTILQWESNLWWCLVWFLREKLRVFSFMLKIFKTLVPRAPSSRY